MFLFPNDATIAFQEVLVNPICIFKISKILGCVNVFCGQALTRKLMRTHAISF